VRTLLVLALVLSLSPMTVRAANEGLEKIISFTTREAEVRVILQTIAQLAGVNIVVDPKIRTRMPFSVKDVTAFDAMHLIAGITGNKMAFIRNVLVVAPEETIKFMLGPGRTELVRLRYAKAEDIAAIVNKVYPKDAQAQHHPPTNTVIIAPK